MTYRLQHGLGPDVPISTRWTQPFAPQSNLTVGLTVDTRPQLRPIQNRVRDPREKLRAVATVAHDIQQALLAGGDDSISFYTPFFAWLARCLHRSGISQIYFYSYCVDLRLAHTKMTHEHFSQILD